MNITSKSTKPQLRDYIALLNSQLITQAKELEHLRMQLSIAQAELDGLAYIHEQLSVIPARAKAQTAGAVVRQFIKQGELWEKVLIDPQRRIYTNRRVSA